MAKVLVLRTAGVNCDEETAHAFRLAGGVVSVLHVGSLLRGEERLEEFDVLAIPGGFSYGDDLGAGTVLANQLRTRLAGDLHDFVDEGKLVIGICNGFQVLVRLGILPGWEGDKAASLIENVSGKFEDRWIDLRVETDQCPFLDCKGEYGAPCPRYLRAPVAHREGRFFLRDPDLGGRIERVVVFGHPTLSREVTALLSDPAVEVIALRGPGEPLGLNGATRSVDAVAVAVDGDSPEVVDAERAWLGAWMRASRAAAVDLSPPAPDVDALSSAVPQERLGAISAELDAVRAPVDRNLLVDAVWRATWPHDRLVFGSSRLVRVADAVLPGKKVTVHANRGLAGIDGTVATATGVAIASQSAGAHGVTRVLLGDLALLHDAGGLLVAIGEAEPRIQIIVGNDGGGTIFDGLEVAATADAEAADRVLYTPHGVDLGRLASAYGWTHTRVTTRAALDQALTTPAAARQVIEVPLAR